MGHALRLDDGPVEPGVGPLGLVELDLVVVDHEALPEGSHPREAVLHLDLRFRVQLADLLADRPCRGVVTFPDGCRQDEYLHAGVLSALIRALEGARLLCPGP